MEQPVEAMKSPPRAHAVMDLHQATGGRKAPEATHGDRVSDQSTLKYTKMYPDNSEMQCHSQIGTAKSAELQYLLLYLPSNCKRERSL